MKEVFASDDVEEVLRKEFYGERKAETGDRKAEPGKLSYKVICISLYHEDLARLDEKVSELKRAGHRKMNRSALIRYALDTADLNGVPRGY